ncbi:MAG: hypothetical protein WAN12_04140 [Candidatus Acidiferrum sp.]
MLSRILPTEMTSVPDTRIGGRIGTGVRKNHFDPWASYYVGHLQKWKRREK